MSKNLIIDYLAGIEVQMNSLKKLLNGLNEDSHNLNFVNIRNQKAKMADFLNDEVVDISSSKYIRDENRIIISAPEIIIGNVDKNGNLIASDGTSKVVIRANQVGLEGVSKDDSLIGVVRTRAPRIHHVAVDPGIDGNENYVGSTSEILSYAKGIELRCEQNEFCPCQSMSESVENGIHLKSPTDIKIVSTSSCKERKSRLANRLKEIDDRIAELSKQLDDSDLSVTTIMNKIREHSESEVYKNVNDPYKVALSYVEIDAANRELESYLIALLKQVNKFFQLYSQLLELQREKYVIQSQQEELDNMEDVPPVSKVQINAPQISMRTVDGDDVFRQDGSIFLNTQALHAYGNGFENKDGAVDTKMNVKFNQVTIDTSKETIDTASNKYVFESSGSFNLYSQNVIVEGVNYERMKDAVDQENKGVNDRSTISLKASKLDFSSLDKEGKNIGEVKINAKNVDILSYDIADGKFKDTDESRFNVYFQTLNIGEVKFESDKTTFSQNIRMAGEDIRFRSGGFFVNLYTNLEKDDNIGYFHLLKNKELKFASNEGIKMSVNGKDRIVVGSDEITVWPGLEAKTSIATPSITVDNLKVDKSFTSPSTKEGTAINGPAPQAPATSKDEPEDKINSPELKLEAPELKKEAEKATEKCNKKIKEWKEKNDEINNIKSEINELKKGIPDLEKKLSIAITNKNNFNFRAQSITLTHIKKTEESWLNNVKLGNKKTDEQKQREAQEAEKVNEEIKEWIDAANKVETEEIVPHSNKLKTKNNEIDTLKTKLDNARKERSQVHKEVEDAMKKEKEAWKKIPGGPIPKRNGETYELIP